MSCPLIYVRFLHNLGTQGAGSLYRLVERVLLEPKQYAVSMGCYVWVSKVGMFVRVPVVELKAVTPRPSQASRSRGRRDHSDSRGVAGTSGC